MFLLVWQILFPIDYLLLPFFLVIWIGLMLLYRNRKYSENDILKKYFMQAFYARLLGAFLTALMYQHYYGYGDTYFYFFGARDIFNAMLTDPTAAYEMVFLDLQDWGVKTFDAVTYRKFFLHHSEAMIIKITGMFMPIGLGTYIGTSFALTTISFLGCWGLYRVFYDMYPHLHKSLAFAILFLPSMCFWSTGIMKDSMVIAGLGFFVNGIYRSIISKEKKIIRSVIFILLGAFLMKNLKLYVLVAILPATAIWIFFMYKERISNPTLKKLATPIFFIGAAVGGVVVMQQLGSIFAQFTFQGFMAEAAKTQWWLKLSTDRDGGTGYDLGALDPSFFGLIKVFPRAVNVALFRPYLWEARKVIVFPSALEALITLGFTIYVFRKVGVLRIFGAIISDPVVLFCLVFAIIFAFAVGFTSFNFGALARYKIPCLPFYYTAMILLWDKVPKPVKIDEKVPEEKPQDQLVGIETNLKPKDV